MDSAAQEALLGDVVRILGSTEDAGSALSQALELVATRIGAQVAAVSRRRPRGSVPEVLARYVQAAAEQDALSRAVLAAPALIADRASPVVMGEIGEGPLLPEMAAAGMDTLVMAPILVADTETVEGVSALAAGRPSRGAVSQKVAAALVLGSGPGVRWSRRHIDLAERLSSVFARRLETDALLRLQERRISELSGLAEVAATVQSTIDPQRLYRGFARAMHTLIAYRHLYIVRVEDDGGLAEVVTFAPGGRQLSTPPLDAAPDSHPWFALRDAERWSRTEADPPSFVDLADHHALLAPMHPKGQILGVVVVATSEPPEAEQCTLVAQAVEQLALALRQRRAVPPGDGARRPHPGARQPGRNRRLVRRSARGVRRVRRGGALADPLRPRSDADDRGGRTHPPHPRHLPAAGYRRRRARADQRLARRRGRGGRWRGRVHALTRIALALRLVRSRARRGGPGNGARRAWRRQHRHVRATAPQFAAVPPRGADVARGGWRHCSP